MRCGWGVQANAIGSTAVNMIEVVSDLVRPSYHRSAAFTGSDLVAQAYSWRCPSCSTDIIVPIITIVNEAWSWERSVGDEVASFARAHFALNVVGKSHDGGWPSILLLRCQGCAAQFVLYSGVREVSNSVYHVTIQGLTHLRPNIDEDSAVEPP